MLGVCLWLARPLRHVRMPAFHARWYELAMRAVLVAILVGVTVTFSFRIGAGGSGILAVFPIVLISIMFILHRRVGGRPTAAVLANAILGLVGFAFACSALHFAAEALGSAWGLAIHARRVDRLEPVGVRRPPASRRDGDRVKCELNSAGLLPAP